MPSYRCIQCYRGKHEIAQRKVENMLKDISRKIHPQNAFDDTNI